MFKTKKTKQHYFLSVMLRMTFFVVSLGASYARANTLDQKCQLGSSDVGGVCMPNATGLSEAPIYVILSSLFSWLMGIFTLFSIGAFVFSGIQYLAGSGDKDLVDSAKSNMNNAFLGIVVGLSGFVLVRAISAALSGQSWFF